MDGPMYEPYEPTGEPLTIQIEASEVRWADDTQVHTEAGGRRRLTIEGLAARVQPYLEAVQLLATLEPESPQLREPLAGLPVVGRALEGYVPGMREARPEQCWRLLEGAFCCILERGHDEGVHEVDDEPPRPHWEVLGTYEGPATVVQGEHRCPVACEYEVGRELLYDVPELGPLPGLISWKGTFTCTGGQLRWPADEVAVLELPDGCTGRMYVTGLEPIEVTAYGNEGYREYLVGGAGTFTGTGHAPHAEGVQA